MLLSSLNIHGLNVLRMILVFFVPECLYSSVVERLSGNRRLVVQTPVPRGGGQPLNACLSFLNIVFRHQAPVGYKF